MAKKETMSIRIDGKTKAALDMIAAERRIQTGKNVTQNEAIWYLIKQGAEHIANRINELSEISEQRSNKSNKTAN